MLFDPKWAVETRPAAFSLEGLIAWLEQQPADREYDWSEAGSCLLGQWCLSNGLQGRDVLDKSLELGSWDNGNGAFADIALGDLRSCTFGAALERARAIASSSGVSDDR